MVVIITKLIITWLESPLLCLSDISLQRRLGRSRINVFASNLRRWSNSFSSDWKTFFAGPTESPSEGLQVCWLSLTDSLFISQGIKSRQKTDLWLLFYSATSVIVLWMGSMHVTTRLPIWASLWLVLPKRPKAVSLEKVYNGSQMTPNIPVIQLLCNPTPLQFWWATTRQL